MISVTLTVISLASTLTFASQRWAIYPHATSHTDFRAFLWQLAQRCHRRRVFDIDCVWRESVIHDASIVVPTVDVPGSSFLLFSILIVLQLLLRVNSLIRILSWLVSWEFVKVDCYLTSSVARDFVHGFDGHRDGHKWSLLVCLIGLAVACWACASDVLLEFKVCHLNFSDLLYINSSLSFFIFIFNNFVQITRR